MNKTNKSDNSLCLDENINQLNINANEFYPKKNSDLLLKKPPVLIDTKKKKKLYNEKYQKDTNEVLLSSIYYILQNE